MKPLLCLASVALVTAAQAHVRQRSFYQYDKTDVAGGGIEAIIHWSQSVPVRMHQFTGCLGSGSTISYDGLESGCGGDAHSLMGDAIAQWFDASLSGIETRFAGVVPSLPLVLDSQDKPLSYPSGCETKTSGDADGVNNIVFTSKIDPSCAASIEEYDGVIGLTRVRYALDSGRIVEADIQFNDLSYEFLATGANDLNATPSQINLQDVAVHELGHFFGLDHSSTRTSSMLFAVSDGMGQASSDDIAGLWSLYPAESSELGSLKGSLTLNDATVFGAVVSVLDARTLKLVASEMTNLDGAFEFCGLPEGNYIAYAASYRPASTNIHEYYSGFEGYIATDGGLCTNPGCKRMNTAIKHSWHAEEGADFGKSMKLFAVSGGTSNKYLNLAASSVVTPMTSSWALSGNTNESTLDLDAPRVMRFRDSNLSHTSTTVTGKNDFLVTAHSDSLNVRVAALELYSRLNVTVTLLYPTTNLALSSGEICTPVAATVTEGKDMQLDCTGLTPGDTYKVRVTAASVPCSDVPGNTGSCSSSSGEVASTEVPYYVINAYDPTVSSTSVLVSALDSSTRATSKYTELPSCTEYVTKLKKSEPAGCCGSIGGGGIDPGTSLWLGLLMSPLTWLLVAIGIHRLLDSRRKRWA